MQRFLCLSESSFSFFSFSFLYVNPQVSYKTRIATPSLKAEEKGSRQTQKLRKMRWPINLLQEIEESIALKKLLG